MLLLAERSNPLEEVAAGRPILGRGLNLGEEALISRLVGFTQPPLRRVAQGCAARAAPPQDLGLAESRGQLTCSHMTHLRM